MDKICIARTPPVGQAHLGPTYQVLQVAPTGANGVPIATMVWPPNHRIVTYAIGRKSKDIPMHYAEVKAINLAVLKWQVEANITFKQVSLTQSPDITFDFIDPTTDNIMKTDSTIMGYSGFPGTDLQGHVKLNDNLNWGWQSVNFSYNVNNTLTHEFGHAIGMEHTPECPRCIMYPVYNGVTELGTDDIIQVTTAYGVRTWANGWYARIKNAIHVILGRTNP